MIKLELYKQQNQPVFRLDDREQRYITFHPGFKLGNAIQMFEAVRKYGHYKYIPENIAQPSPPKVQGINEKPREGQLQRRAKLKK